MAGLSIEHLPGARRGARALLSMTERDVRRMRMSVRTNNVRPGLLLGRRLVLLHIALRLHRCHHRRRG